MFKLENVNKTFITEQSIINAVDHVSLEIKGRQIFGVIAASGAGKSTQIRCLNLLEYPDSGKLSLKVETYLNYLRKK